jgi:hypothetical protein
VLLVGFETVSAEYSQHYVGKHVDHFKHNAVSYFWYESYALLDEILGQSFVLTTACRWVVVRGTRHYEIFSYLFNQP